MLRQACTIYMYMYSYMYTLLFYFMAMTGTTFTQRRLKPLSRLCLMVMLVVFSLCPVKRLELSLVDQVVLFVSIGWNRAVPEGPYFEDCSAAD